MHIYVAHRRDGLPVIPSPPQLIVGPLPASSSAVMVEQMQINCPQPIKPLSKKLSQSGLHSETVPSVFKWQQDSLLTQRASIENWLLDCSGRSQDRYDTCPVFGSTKEHGDQRSRSDSFVSAQKCWRSTFSMSGQLPYATFDSTRIHRFVELSGRSDQIPAYRRETLQPHGIYIDPVGRQVPEQITNVAYDILHKPRTSTRLINDQVQDLQ